VLPFYKYLLELGSAMKIPAARPHEHGERTSQQLSARTWPKFDRLFANNEGVWGGCWCLFYHQVTPFDSNAYARNRTAKRKLVVSGKAHGTIVFCGEEPVGWCQFGPKEELPRIDGRKNYVPTAIDAWRVTCFFVDRAHRRKGFSQYALQESIAAMKKLGVKSIEAYPVEGRRTATELWNGTPPLFEKVGFSRVGPLGKDSWIYSLRV
jgi:GNAT superfamily N-acetyltransferase